MRCGCWLDGQSGFVGLLVWLSIAVACYFAVAPGRLRVVAGCCGAGFRGFGLCCSAVGAWCMLLAVGLDGLASACLVRGLRMGFWREK